MTILFRPTLTTSAEEAANRPSTTALQAVLFDMDGTLVDSEKLWTVALDRVSAELGGRMSVEAREASIGSDIHATVDRLLADLGVDQDHDQVVSMLLDATAEVFREGLPWRPGAEALLDSVRAAGLTTALVTATHSALVEIAWGTLGRDRFDVAVCGDQVTQPKPHPEPYLRALDLLGLPAAAAVAVEDSPTGSTAAAEAGLPVLVVPLEVPVPQRPGLVFADSLIDVDVLALQRIRASFDQLD